MIENSKPAPFSAKKLPHFIILTFLSLSIFSQNSIDRSALDRNTQGPISLNSNPEGQKEESSVKKTFEYGERTSPFFNGRNKNHNFGKKDGHRKPAQSPNLLAPNIEKALAAQFSDFPTIGEILTLDPSSSDDEPFPSEPLPSETPEKSEHAEASVVFFILFCLFIGSVCIEIKKKTGLPYTPMLLVIGMLLGIYSNSLQTLGFGVKTTLEINPHGILLIFIPILIFESSFNIDPFVLRNELIQIILLAGPGVLLGALILGFVFNGLLGYSAELPWSAAFSLASIICATDPVAVVALLKEVGAPTKFNVLLEGESLLNDGTAMVFFILFSELYKGSGVSAGGLVLKFLQLTVGGVLTGASACMLVLFWLKQIIRHHLLTVNLTLLSCYFTFFITEFYVGGSGIIAIMTLGILMGSFGKYSANPESLEWIHTVLSYLQFVLETVLFVITGCYIGKNLLQRGPQSSISEADFFRVLVFFPLMTLGRFAMIMILRPLINKTGWPIGLKDALLLTHAGLRGSIALCLALMVAVDEALPARFRELSIFFVICMIVFTVVLNGLSFKVVMKWIGLKKGFEKPDKLKEVLRRRLVVEAMMHKSFVLEHKLLGLAQWPTVVELSGLKKDARRSLIAREKEIKNFEEGLEAGLLPTESIYAARQTAYQQLKARVWLSFEESLCSAAAVRKLRDTIDFCMEDLATPLWIDKAIIELFVETDKIAQLSKWGQYACLGYFARRILLTYLLESYEILFVLTESAREVQEKREAFAAGLGVYGRKVLDELDGIVKACEEHLFGFINAFPELAMVVQNRQSAKILINKQKELVNSAFKSGAMDEREHEELIHKLQKRLRKLETSSFSLAMPNVHILKLIYPIFGHIKPENFELLVHNLTVVNFKKDQPLLTKDKPATAVYIIKKGTCHGGENFQRLRGGRGSVFSFANLLSPSGLAVTTVLADETVEAFSVPNKIVLSMLAEEPELEEHVYRVRLAFIMRKNQGGRTLSFKELHPTIEMLVLSKPEENDLVTLEHGGYLFSGELEKQGSIELQEKAGAVNFKDGSFLPESFEPYKAVKKSCLMIFGAKGEGFEERQTSMFKLKDNRASYVGLLKGDMSEEEFYQELEKKILDA